MVKCRCNLVTGVPHMNIDYTDEAAVSYLVDLWFDETRTALLQAAVAGDKVALQALYDWYKENDVELVVT